MDSQSTARRPLATLPAKPLVSEFKQDSNQIYYGLANLKYALVDYEYSQLLHVSPCVHEGRIGCIRSKDNLLMTGGWDNYVKMYDERSMEQVQAYQKVPGKFNAIDKTGHILAAATGSHVIFWDLRKGKQRADFKDSFNGEVSYIRFEDEIGTNLFGCSIDGMVNMFDLTQLNEQQSLNWGYKIIDSPISMSIAQHSRALVRTHDHNLYKIQDGDLFGKVSPNHVDQPRHILHAQFRPNSGYQIYDYFTWSPQNKDIEYWSGRFEDKSNSEQCGGYLCDVRGLELANFTNKGEGYLGVYADENGNVYCEGFTKERAPKTSHDNGSESTQTKQNNKKMWSFQKRPQGSSSSQKPNKNGYVLEKPVSSFVNHKKFKPY